MDQFKEMLYSPIGLNFVFILMAMLIVIATIFSWISSIAPTIGIKLYSNGVTIIALVSLGFLFATCIHVDGFQWILRGWISILINIILFGSILVWFIIKVALPISRNKSRDS